LEKVFKLIIRDTQRGLIGVEVEALRSEIRWTRKLKGLR
jgi:hypothetical protein